MKRLLLGLSALAFLGLCAVLTGTLVLYGMWQSAAASSVLPTAVVAEDNLPAAVSNQPTVHTVLLASEPDDVPPTDEPAEPTPEPATPTPESATPTPEPVVADNSVTADDFRISLIKTAEGDEALNDLASSQWIEHVLSLDSVPGQREGWKLFEAQFAIENLSPYVRQAPRLCTLLIDSGGYSRVEPVDGTCPGNRCGPQYDKSGFKLEPDRDLWAVSGVRYSGLRVFMELPITMQPVTMTLYTSASGNCADQAMATNWGVYDFNQPPANVTIPFDAPPDSIPTVGDGNSALWYGDVGISIDNVRIEPNKFGQDSFVLVADATYTNEGGMDVDTNQYPVYALTVHQSGKYIGKYEGFDGVIPPGVPKTFQVQFGYADKAEYAGTWFYVVFVDGAGNTIGQAQVELPADIIWAP